MKSTKHTELSSIWVFGSVFGLRTFSDVAAKHLKFDFQQETALFCLGLEIN